MFLTVTLPMPDTRSDLCAFDLISSGQTGFSADDDWLAAQRKAGVLCPQCEAFQPARRSRIDQIVVGNTKTLSLSFGYISWIAGAGIILGERLLQVVAPALLPRSRLLPIVGTNGLIHRQQFLVEDANRRGCVRGSHLSRTALCRGCGRLLYWPIGKRYVLRRYLGDSKFRILGGSAILDAGFYETDIAPLRLPRLSIKKWPLVVSPEDGMPASYREMLKVVGKRKA